MEGEERARAGERDERARSARGRAGRGHLQGRRCPFKRRTATVNAKGNAHLLKFFKRKLRPKITIEVRVTYPNSIGRVGRFRIKRADVPNMQRLCLPPGETKAKRC